MLYFDDKEIPDSCISDCFNFILDMVADYKSIWNLQLFQTCVLCKYIIIKFILKLNTIIRGIYKIYLSKYMCQSLGN